MPQDIQDIGCSTRRKKLLPVGIILLWIVVVLDSTNAIHYHPKVSQTTLPSRRRGSGAIQGQTIASAWTVSTAKPWSTMPRHQSLGVPPTIAAPFSMAWWWYHARVGIAGGVAGAVGTTVLHPFDCAKTLRQSNPEKFQSVRTAFWSLLSSSGAPDSTIRTRLYAGVMPAAVGAIPSSALYFGAYEAMKSLLLQMQEKRSHGKSSTFLSRLWVHAAAAASGNVLSSAVFVPKEFLKQQLQYNPGSTIQQVIAKHGVRGLYRTYQATLMRNIPTAALRFVLYEELKWVWYTQPKLQRRQRAWWVRENEGNIDSQHWKLFLAGAVAGAVASGIMTPVDVLKTRLSTGNCPVEAGINACFNHVRHTNGWSALYAGAGSRMFFSGAFSAVGFGTFELVKRWLRVSSRTTKNKSLPIRRSYKSSK